MNNANAWKTAKRLMGYVAGTLRLQFMVVCIAILVSAVAAMAGPLFLQYLIDDLIAPLAMQETPDFDSLLRAVLLMGCLYYAGVIATYVYSRLMVNIGQGVLKRVRDEMFAHMQRLPIRYFDTHPHGEIMSLYTNDTDTLRQMISQSIPQTFYSLVSVVAIFGVMLTISIPLSILAVLMVVLMFIVVIVGLAMDVTPSILILTPIMLPLVEEAGISPIYFGVCFVLMNVLGLTSPPVGPILNVACATGNIKMDKIIGPTMPYFIAQTVLCFLLAIFPPLVEIPMGWFGVT